MNEFNKGLEFLPVTVQISVCVQEFTQTLIYCSQLRVIRAFRSTLEDMEEKRSIHSLRSGQRSGLGGYYGHHHHSAIDGPRSGSRKHQPNNQSHAHDYHLRVEGQPYRVQRTFASHNNSASSGGGGITNYDPSSNTSYNSSSINNNNNTTNPGGKPISMAVPTINKSSSSGMNGNDNPTTTRVRRCSDAQTQSQESSFAPQSAFHSHQQFNDGSAAGHHQGLTVNCSAVEAGVPSVQVGQSAGFGMAAVPSSATSLSRGPSPVFFAPVPSPQPPLAAGSGYQQQQFLSPQPVAAPPPVVVYANTSSGYDPSYCQPLGQAADGFQYELVRRPSNVGIMPPPPAADLLRRASTGNPAAQASISQQASFDSAAAPTMTAAATSSQGYLLAAPSLAPPGGGPPSPLYIQSSSSPAHHFAPSPHHIPASTAAAFGYLPSYSIAAPPAAAAAPNPLIQGQIATQHQQLMGAFGAAAAANHQENDTAAAAGDKTKTNNTDFLPKMIHETSI